MGGWGRVRGGGGGRGLYNLHVVIIVVPYEYRIRSNYCTYPYKRTVKKFSSLQITASVLFLYFFIEAYVVVTHLNCIDLSMQFK